MGWYLLNILILTIVYLWPNVNGTEKIANSMSVAKKKAICIVGSTIWILLSGLRHISIGNDTLNYRDMFGRVENRSWAYLLGQVKEKFINGEDILDPGFFVFNKIMSVFTRNYQIYLILFAILFFTIFGFFVYKFSANPYISYVLFSCLFYSFYALTGLRQTLATAIVVFLGVLCIKKRNLILFLILMAIGMTIHFSSLCFLPFYFLSKIKINFKTLTFYWIAIVAAFVGRYNLLSIMQSIAGYEEYVDYEGARAGIFMLLLLCVAAFVTVFHKKILENNSNASININAIMMSCIFVPLSLINQSLMRIVYYYALFLMFMIPDIKGVFAKNNDKKIFELVAVLVMVVLLIDNNPTYMFFWQ